MEIYKKNINVPIVGDAGECMKRAQMDQYGRKKIIMTDRGLKIGL